MASLTTIARTLSRQVDELEFSSPVEFIYNPLAYAAKPHRQYLARFRGRCCANLWLGMNPGPFGMAQTGVPFGEVELVRDYVGIEAPVDKPEHEHPKRPIQGFQCPRSEVSGRRLWGWVAQRWPQPDDFFARNHIYNYCPLVFMADTGRNITPDKLPALERDPLFAACDQALRAVIDSLRVERIIAVGTFAEKRAGKVLAESGIDIFRVPHPSPASPLANRGWDAAIEASLEQQGLQSLL